MNTKDVVLIPSFNRPEFLAVCLELIEKNPESKKLLFRFCFDHGSDPKCCQVAYEFAARGFDILTGERIDRYANTFAKQSYNVLTGLKESVSYAKDYVFLIEEDIFVANDFFKWHYISQRAAPKSFCTIATKNNNKDVPLNGNLTDNYYTQGDYQSLGVCFRKEVIQEHIVPHINAEYFTSSGQYCHDKFPDSKLGQIYTEQDGLIRRIQEGQSTMPIVFPHVPRAYHAGFYGKNRGKGKCVEGPYEERLAYVRHICFSDKRMKEYAENEAYYRDSQPVNLVNPNW